MLRKVKLRNYIYPAGSKLEACGKLSVENLIFYFKFISNYIFLVLDEKKPAM